MFTHKYKDIISIENLLLTWTNFAKGKRHKKDVIEFEIKLADNLIELFDMLKNKTYKHAGYSAFNISDPKPRNIHKAIVRDRVLHHLIYKELYDYFDKKFIYDSYSCRKNKGTHRAFKRVKIFADKVSKNNTRTCYILKCDIRKFFASVDHNILFLILKRHIEDPEILWLLKQVISSFRKTDEDIGLPLGNLTSQLLVNVYMHEFDMFIKQKLKVKYYIRYADDFIIISDKVEFLENLLLEIKFFLKDRLKLDLHKDKVFIKTYASGVDFLGWVHFPYHRQIRTTTKRKMIRKLSKHSKPQTISSYRGLLSHGNAYKFQKKLNLL
jgi:hypothetical protein